MDELDVEALLEAPYVNGGKSEDTKSSRTEPSSKKRSRSRSGSRHRSGSKRDGDRDRDRNRSDRGHGRDDRARDRDRTKDDSSRSSDRRHDDRDRRRDDTRGRGRDDDRRDRDRDSRRSRSRERKHRSRSRDGDRRQRDGSKDQRSHNRSLSPIRKPEMPELTPEERDQRTVVCMQLASRIRSEDLDEFFSAVGKVAEVRLVTDRKRKSKGIAYVEFVDVESVPLAIALTGQKLLGVPIVVQMSHAEKNRLAAMQAAAAAAAREAGGGTPGAASGFIPGAAKLYVGSLHYNISEDMLRAIFEPFGKLLDVSIVKDQKTGQSQGFAFLTFRNAEDASVALVQMNGFPLAGRPLKVGRSERSACFPDVSEIDKLGTLLASSSAASSEALSAATAAASLIGSLPQLQDPLAGMPVGLMAPGLMPGIGQDLTASLGMGSIPGLGLNTTTSALGLGMSQGMSMAFAPPPALAAPPVTAAAPPISTDCLLVSNLFDPNKQMAPGWDASLSDDIVRECARHNAAVTHIAVDRASAQGNVYVKCESVTAALAAVTALHGRYFDGRLVTVAYVPTEIYHSLFPGAALQAPAAASTALASAGLSSGMPGAV